jgi:hypothetical protein
MATPSGSWGTITAICLCTALTSGEVLFYDDGVSEDDPDDGDTVQLSAGNCDWTMD